LTNSFPEKTAKLSWHQLDIVEQNAFHPMEESLLLRKVLEFAHFKWDSTALIMKFSDNHTNKFLTPKGLGNLGRKSEMKYFTRVWKKFQPI